MKIVGGNFSQQSQSGGNDERVRVNHCGENPAGESSRSASFAGLEAANLLCAHLALVLVLVPIPTCISAPDKAGIVWFPTPILCPIHVPSLGTHQMNGGPCNKAESQPSAQ